MIRQRGLIPIALILYAVAGLAIVAGVWAFHNHGVNQGRAEIQAKWDDAVRKQREEEEERIATASTKLETANAKARVITRTITVEVDKIIDRPIYRNVCLDSDGLRIAQCAIRGQSPDSCKPDKPMRPAPVAGRWDWGERFALDNRYSGPLP